jgi:hypothetical protein
MVLQILTEAGEAKAELIEAGFIPFEFDGDVSVVANGTEDIQALSDGDHAVTEGASAQSVSAAGMEG